MKPTPPTFWENAKKIGRWATFSLAQLLLIPDAHAALATTGGELITNVICPIAGTMFTFLLVISVIMVLWAAYLFVTAQDDAEKVTKARKTITYAAVAVVVALLAKGFPYIVSSVFPSSGAAITSCP